MEVKEETHQSSFNEDLIGETRFHDLPPCLDSNGGHVVTSPDGGLQKIIFANIFILVRKSLKCISPVHHEPCIIL